jgi:multicomponent Na+:H+ antiporter subunit G
MIVVDLLSWACILTGAAFSIIGGAGLLRMPDFYTRAHAVGVTDTFGAGFLILGLALQSGFSQVSIKLFLALGFMLVTGPVASHALVKAAYARGLSVGPSGPARSSSDENEGDSTVATGE